MEHDGTCGWPGVPTNPRHASALTGHMTCARIDHHISQQARRLPFVLASGDGLACNLGSLRAGQCLPEPIASETWKCLWVGWVGHDTTLTRAWAAYWSEACFSSSTSSCPGLRTTRKLCRRWIADCRLRTGECQRNAVRGSFSSGTSWPLPGITSGLISDRSQNT